jgi:hypothetical protein
LKIGSIVLSWLISVIAGSAICGLLLGEPVAILLFVLVSGLFSLPYLAVMILFNLWKHPFWLIQVMHVFLTLFTGFTIFLFERSSFKYFYVLLIYFVFGVIAQTYFYFRKPLQETYVNPDILDS